MGQKWEGEGFVWFFSLFGFKCYNSSDLLWVYIVSFCPQAIYVVTCITESLCYIHLKLIQHCQPTIRQQKKILKKKFHSYRYRKFESMHTHTHTQTLYIHVHSSITQKSQKLDEQQTHCVCVHTMEYSLAIKRMTHVTT